MSRWGDSDSEDEDFPRASSFVNTPQNGTQYETRNNKESHHYGSTSSAGGNTSYQPGNQRNKFKRNEKSKGVKGRVNGGKSNVRAADWREMARNSQKYSTKNGNELDGSAWMAQRAENQKKRDEEERRQQAEHRQKMEEENREKRKNQFGALKQSLLLQKQDDVEQKEENHVSSLSKLAGKMHNSPPQKDRPKLKLAPRTKPLPDTSSLKTGNESTEKYQIAKEEESNRKVEKILTRPKQTKSSKPSKSLEKKENQKSHSSIGGDNNDDEKSLLSSTTHSTHGSSTRQTDKKRNPRKNKSNKPNNENNKSNPRKGKKTDGDTRHHPADVVQVGKAKTVKSSHGEIEFHVTLENVKANSKFRGEYSRNAKHKYHPYKRTSGHAGDKNFETSKKKNTEQEKNNKDQSTKGDKDINKDKKDNHTSLKQRKERSNSHGQNEKGNSTQDKGNQTEKRPPKHNTISQDPTEHTEGKEAKASSYNLGKDRNSNKKQSNFAQGKRNGQSSKKGAVKSKVVIGT